MLTHLFATYNGAHTLPRVLDALTQIEEPDGGWRLVVVDNASTDGTADILAAYAARLPLVVLSEAQRGQNAARNKGLDICVGDLAVFTDDDAVPEPGWLRRIRAAADAHPEFDVFAGTILPLWEREPPRWIVAGVPAGPAFALTAPGQPTGEIPPTMGFGANFAVRARHFRQGARFRTDLGPRGRSYVMGGETELLKRLAARGARALFIEDAIVHHIVRPWQFDPAWLRRRAYIYGRGQFQARHGHPAPGSSAGDSFVARRRRVRRLVFQTVPGLIRASVTGDRARLAESRWALWRDLGWLREMRFGRALDGQARHFVEAGPR